MSSTTKLIIFKAYAIINIMNHKGKHAQLAGKLAEQNVINTLNSGEWTAILTSGTEADYAHKTDAVANCPAGLSHPLQISRSSKSKRQQDTLRKRGITPVAEKSTCSAQAQICSNCVLNASCELQIIE